MSPATDPSPGAAPKKVRTGFAGAEIPPGEERIITVPNFITISRFLCIPIFLWLLFGREARVEAAILLAVLGATDWVDGQVARRFDQVTELGKMLDPTVDRLLLVTGITAIIIDGSVPLWFGLLSIGREVAVALFMVVITAMGARRIDVTIIGKVQTFLTMCAYPLFLASADTGLADSTADSLRMAAYLCAVPGLILGYCSLVMYIPMGRRALAEGREMRAAAANLEESTT